MSVKLYKITWNNNSPFFVLSNGPNNHGSIYGTLVSKINGYPIGHNDGIWGNVGSEAELLESDTEITLKSVDKILFSIADKSLIINTPNGSTLVTKDKIDILDSHEINLNYDPYSFTKRINFNGKIYLPISEITFKNRL